MKKTDLVKDVCKLFAARDPQAIVDLRAMLDAECVGHALTNPLLHATFLMTHPAGDRTIGELVDIMADVVKTCVRKRCSAGAYPIDMATDGTMTVLPDEPLVKTFGKHSIEQSMLNWGETRLGVSPRCANVNPLAFNVLVGPFVEQVESLERIKAADEQR
jgi:hypothetical protein